MDQIHISKGVAYMIRAILNIEPEQVERQLNDVIAKSAEAFAAIQGTVKRSDDLMSRMETELAGLKESHSRLNDMLIRWDNERRDFNAGKPQGGFIGNGADNAKPNPLDNGRSNGIDRTETG